MLLSEEENQAEITGILHHAASCHQERVLAFPGTAPPPPILLRAKNLPGLVSQLCFVQLCQKCIAAKHLSNHVEACQLPNENTRGSGIYLRLHSTVMTILESSFLVPGHCFVYSLQLPLSTRQALGKSRPSRVDCIVGKGRALWMLGSRSKASCSRVLHGKAAG